MLADIFEQWQVMRQALAPLRLTKWQMTRMFAAQINRDMPILSKVLVAAAILFLLWVLTVLTRPPKLEQLLDLPVLGGSRTLKHDFLQVIQEGKRKVCES